ncbi:translation machinery associated TMA7-domain-containing protein [Trametes polyzona]|nr:translation machinery associated TMA7-domain-containing protein [Trametes polyzona]
MASRQGGKLKPLKAPKKDKKDMDEDEIAFKEKKKQEEAALKAARDKGTVDRFSQCQTILIRLFSPQLPRVSKSSMIRSMSLAALTCPWERRRCSRWRDQEVWQEVSCIRAAASTAALRCIRRARRGHRLSVSPSRSAPSALKCSVVVRRSWAVPLPSSLGQ